MTWPLTKILNHRVGKTRTNVVSQIVRNFGSFAGNGLNRHPGYIGLTLAQNIISPHQRFIINFGISSIASNFMNYSTALLLFSTAFGEARRKNRLYHELMDRCARELRTFADKSLTDQKKVSRGTWRAGFIQYYIPQWSHQVFKVPTRILETSIVLNGLTMLEGFSTFREFLDEPSTLKNSMNSAEISLGYMTVRHVDHSKKSDNNKSGRISESKNNGRSTFFLLDTQYF